MCHQLFQKIPTIKNKKAEKIATINQINSRLGVLVKFCQRNTERDFILKDLKNAIEMATLPNHFTSGKPFQIKLIWLFKVAIWQP